MRMRNFAKFRKILCLQKHKKFRTSLNMLAVNYDRGSSILGLLFRCFRYSDVYYLDPHCIFKPKIIPLCYNSNEGIPFLKEI